MTAYKLPAVLLLALAACGPKVVPVAVAPVAPVAPVPPRADGVPAPLPARTFAIPKTTQATLSNGLTVVVAENHEVPLAWVRLAFRTGSLGDPAGKEGLAAVTLDMMNEGAGEYDAIGLSNALMRLGSDLGTGAGDDGATVSASGLTANLDATLDLFSTVLLDPTFPQTEWDLLKKQRIADLDKKRKDPEWIASRVFDRVIFQDTYRGRAATKASYDALTPAAMRAWWAANLTPDRAVLFAGGDVSLETLVPKLEARLKAWKPSGAPASTPVEVAAPAAPTGPAPIHFVDRPGAAQSMIRVGGYLSTPESAEWFPLLLANQAVGGLFTARINMNLREDKGWTYGARSGLGYDLAGGRFVASAGVRTDVTGPALGEILAEISAPTGARPLTAAEIDDGRASIVQSYPLRFESPDYLLGQAEAVWRYGLPADWVEGYVSRLDAVSLDGATAAWKDKVDPARLVIVVVGDGATVREGLAALGRPIIEHDAEGSVLPKKPEGKALKKKE
ncbi:MAG: pitrilysin family protein [Pseudomonadota bacterium]|nr:pitrilysin family protein [Pseudomonadota bacterium]